MTSRFDHEFNLYLSKQDEFVKDHDGEWVVIKGNEILGFYTEQLEAIEETQKEYEIGTFMVQHITKGEAEYTRTFHSRVAIA